MAPHSTEIEQLAAGLGANLSEGLTNARAGEIRAKVGENKLREKPPKSTMARFVDQFKDVMIIILIIAAAISFGIAIYEGNAREFFEPVLILVIVILNAVIGVAQESKAEKALTALKGLSAPHARVLRDGAENLIAASELVPGDIIMLEAGDFVPADARLIRSSSLKVEESALTGESVPSEKDADAAIKEDAPLGDRRNMVFSGCGVTYGTGKALVTATGMNSEMGKIAGMLEQEDEGQTPLQSKLAKMGKYLGLVALAACAVIFALGLIDGIPAMTIFMTAVSLAVSAIPEGLPAIVTIVLSIGVQRMVKRNAIIRRLPAVETLGSASVICSDKTGTLTQNRMTLTKVYVDGAEGPVEVTTDNDEAVRALLKYGTLCSNGAVAFNGKEVTHIGDPTETAIVLAAHRNGMLKEALARECPRFVELPFDSDRKLMSVVCRVDGKNLVIVKGAIDSLLPRCVKGDFSRAKAVCDAMAESALRVLAVGVKEIADVPSAPKMEELESGLTFVGLVGMIDPPRPEVREAVKLCGAAGIRPVMITGDHVVTASAIASDLGIRRPGDKAMTGAELSKWTDEQLDANVRDVSVYARVSPEDKIRIVKAWQRQGEVVAMTGDGVNDAPALKAADIGCAMGITGTDVAKGAADMTLTDDNFTTIVEAVREGRGIYDNILKVVGFLLGTNIGEVLTVFVAMLIWRVSPLMSMQLLMINLATDSLPAIALGMEPVEDDIMSRKPRPKTEGIFANHLGLRVCLQGCLFAALTLFAYWLGNSVTGQAAGGQTMAFAVLALSQVVQAFNMRSRHSLFASNPFANKQLNGAALISSALIAMVLFTPVATAFELILLPGWMYWAVLGLSLVPIPVMELFKAAKIVK